MLPSAENLVLGIMPGISYRQDVVTLEPGDIAVLYTDGVTEAMNLADEQFGESRLRAIFADRQPKSARAVSDAIFEAVHAFSGNAPQSDDITCLVVVREA